MYIDLNIGTILDESQVKKLVTEIIVKKINGDSELIKEIITEAIKGSIKREVNNIVQSNEYRTFIRNKILEKLGIKGELE